MELLKRNGWSVPGPSRGGVCQGPVAYGGAPESRVIKCIGKTSFGMRSGDN